QLDFFEFEVALLFTSVFVFFRLLVLEATVVGDFADRRLCRRRDFDQVETCRSRSRQRVFGGEDPELFSVFVDDSYLTNPYLIVDAQRSCYGNLSPKSFAFRGPLESKR